MKTAKKAQATRASKRKLRGGAITLTNLQLAWLAQLTTLARINAGRKRELMPLRPYLTETPRGRTAEINGGLAPESESEEGRGGGHGGDQEPSRPTSRNAKRKSSGGFEGLWREEGEGCAVRGHAALLCAVSAFKEARRRGGSSRGEGTD